MSQTYIAVIVGILVELLPHLGVTVGSDALTTTIQTIVLLASGAWILIRRYKQGDVTVVGVRKY